MRRPGVGVNRRVDVRGMVGAASGGAPAPFSYDDIPSQLLRIDAAQGFILSGTDVVAIADQSSAAETITITGTPQYTASNANLNGEPSFSLGSGSIVTTPGIVRADIKFFAMVSYSGVTSLVYFWDQSDTAHGMRVYRLSGNIGGAFGSFAAAGEPVVGRKRVVANFDTTGRYFYYNGTNLGTPGALAPTGTNGVTWGSANDGTSFVELAFIMACSAPPSSGDRASLEDYLTTRFG